jgi:subtilisin family serine protease
MPHNFESYLEARAEAPIKIWVFFTDKNISDRAGFVQAAASLNLTDRARRRRAKVGRDHVVFTDLPVAASYVQAIENLGAGHRRSSRWLNAATFEVRADLVETVAQLPFVAEIRPMLSSRRVVSPETEERPAPPIENRSGEYALAYGDSFWQLEQLNIPAVHDLGYSGLGVTIAFLDTGHRYTHDAVSRHVSEGRVLAQYDFVHNDGNTSYEPGDAASEWSHGTQLWAIAAGYDPGVMYGGSYQANFILCKTEDVSSETSVEEDNWVAALEFVDSIGADVISTSLGYFLFDDTCNCNYTYADMDGQTATISIAASMADGLGMVLCKSAGNSGPSAGSITAPADAFDILAAGSVNGTGSLAASSSRGPTYDGRIKPEVCARGVSTYTASIVADHVYGPASGTSFAQPLIAGAVGLIIEAHPDWTPFQVREALKASGHMADTPDNNFGWGIPDVLAAIQSEPPCCQTRVGNVLSPTGGEPSLVDVMGLIDFLYISGQSPPCLAEADINQSGGTIPGPGDITISDIARLIDYLYISLNVPPDCL